MPHRQTASRLALAAALAAALAPAAARAETIIDRWKSVPVPAAPELRQADVDAAHAALLVLDVNAEACAKRPTCVRSLPLIHGLLVQARARHMPVIYSTSSSAPTAPVPEPLAHAPGDLTVTSSADKFVGTDLEKTLAARGVTTVIVVGTTAEGAVVYTASAAALRKLSVVVPVDGWSSDAPFGELVAAWLLKNAPVSVSSHVTLTRTDMITLL